MIFILELNALQPYATNIGNAYLKAHTTEKLWIITPTEFGEQAHHLLVVNKYCMDCVCQVSVSTNILDNAFTTLVLNKQIVKLTSGFKMPAMSMNMLQLMWTTCVLPLKNR